MLYDLQDTPRTTPDVVRDDVKNLFHAHPPMFSQPRSSMSTISHGDAFGDSTNIPCNAPRPKLSRTKHPRFSLSGSRKASPTVSITSANASCINGSAPLHVPLINLSSQDISIIPFPSSAIPFPISTPSAQVSESDSSPDCLTLLRSPHLDVSSRHGEAGTEGPFRKDNPARPHHVRPRASQAELRHRRSQARIAQSTFRHPSASTGVSSADGTHRKAASGKKRRCTRKRSKDLDTDLQHLELVYRSIAWRWRHDGMEGRIYDSPSSTTGGEGLQMVMEAQDKLLLKRLSDFLVERGCSPATYGSMISSSGPLEIISPEGSTALGLSDHTDHPSEPELKHKSSRSNSPPNFCSLPGLAVSHLLTPSQVAPPPPFPSGISLSASPPGSHVGLPPTRILTIPQVVASLILRHRDRATQRVRASLSSCSIAVAAASPGHGQRRSSPLALSVIPGDQTTAMVG